MPHIQYFSPTVPIHIGCSGWQYRHWRGDFYPAELPQSLWLEYYAERFDTVEINNTFYRLPEAPTFAAWGRRAPRGFVYAVKASRFLTHMKKLKDPEEPLQRFFTRARRLEHAFGPVLYQLPPNMHVNLERLSTFLQALPRTRRHAIEFRDPSWYVDEVFAELERHKVALCLHDMKGSAAAIPIRSSTDGRRGSRIASATAVRFTRISTTTREATPRATPSGCAPHSGRESVRVRRR
jgi:uncharacterized protein YecE (DUF72 family)